MLVRRAAAALSIYLSIIYLSIYLSIYLLTIYLSNLSILSIDLSIYMYLSIYQ